VIGIGSLVTAIQKTLPLELFVLITTPSLPM
jgi:hypothetical protein